MPYVNIKLTGDSEAPTPEQKEQLIAGVTKLIADVLGKDTTHLDVVIDEVPMAPTMASMEKPSKRFVRPKRNPASLAK